MLCSCGVVSSYSVVVLCCCGGVSSYSVLVLFPCVAVLCLPPEVSQHAGGSRTHEPRPREAPLMITGALGSIVTDQSGFPPSLKLPFLPQLLSVRLPSIPKASIPLSCFPPSLASLPEVSVPPSVFSPSLKLSSLSQIFLPFLRLPSLPQTYLSPSLQLPSLPQASLPQASFTPLGFPSSLRLSSLPQASLP